MLEILNGLGTFCAKNRRPLCLHQRQDSPTSSAASYKSSSTVISYLVTSPTLLWLQAPLKIKLFIQAYDRV